MFRNLASTCAFPAVLAMAACAASKSADPLSPTVAGPIPGVNITSPSIMQPSLGAKVSVEQQPLTLTVGNAASSGVRPLTYVFEIAADASFANKVFSRDGIAPGASQTSLKLPDALATGRTYFWHARAEDGANTGPFSTTAAFDVFTPIVIGAAVPTAPIDNVRVDSLHPLFSFNNAPHSGPVGPLTYLIEVADTDSFANRLAAWTVAEQPGQTGLDSPQDFPINKQLFWRVRAADTTTAGPYSPVQVFQTPLPVVVAPPPPPAPGPGPIGPAPTDSLDLRQASIYNSPSDLANWAVTARITSVIFTPNAFLVDFDRRNGPNRWPDIAFGDPGDNLQYTLGMCLNINNHWDCSAVVQFWYGRDLGASAPPSEIATAWFYDSRWGPLMGRQPADGETVGIFVCAGDCRNKTSVSTIHERSNVQFVTWSNRGGPAYTFSSGPPMLFINRR
jgi:hypothetical protein